LYFSRKLLEDHLKSLGLDYYQDIPVAGDVVRIQESYWEVMNSDPEGFHMNFRNFPFDLQYNIVLGSGLELRRLRRSISLRGIDGFSWYGNFESVFVKPFWRRYAKFVF